jgi:hypothetical protein
MQACSEARSRWPASLWSARPRARSSTAPNAAPRSTSGCARFSRACRTAACASTMPRNSAACAVTFSPQPPAPSAGRRGRTARAAARPIAPLPATRGSLLAAAPGAVEEELREAMILARLFAQPALLIARFEDDLWRARPAVRRIAPRRPPARHRAPHAPARPRRADRRPAAPPSPPARTPACRRRPPADAAGRSRPRGAVPRRGFRRPCRPPRRAREIAEAVDDLDALPDEGLTWRLSQAAAALEKAGRSAAAPDRSGRGPREPVQPPAEPDRLAGLGPQAPPGPS